MGTVAAWGVPLLGLVGVEPVMGGSPPYHLQNVLVDLHYDGSGGLDRHIYAF